jgi:hypothetical protein
MAVQLKIIGLLRLQYAECTLHQELTSECMFAYCQEKLNQER